MKPMLIQEFEKDHLNILNILEKIKVNLSKKDIVLDLLKEFDTILNIHLQKEDKELYPYLIELAKQNQELKSTMDVFAQGLMNLGKFIKTFLGYKADKVNTMDWNKEFGRLYTNLKTRIRREENILYPYYKEI